VSWQEVALWIAGGLGALWLLSMLVGVLAFRGASKRMDRLHRCWWGR
jgi:hypothetical protein